LLRKANYNIETIRYVLDQLATDSPEQALKAAENRLQELTDISYRCMQATAELWRYVADMQLFHTN
jgi:Na+/phosphate symporter